jgi:hypothetical protein
MRSTIRVTSVALRKSPMSFAWDDEVPQISTRKTRLRPQKFWRLRQNDFATVSAKPGHAVHRHGDIRPLEQRGYQDRLRRSRPFDREPEAVPNHGPSPEGPTEIATIATRNARNPPSIPRLAAEMALTVLAYNRTRVMNIVGIKPLIAAIAA